MALAIGYFIFSLFYFVSSIIACISLFTVAGDYAVSDTLVGVAFVSLFAIIILLSGVGSFYTFIHFHTLRLFLYDNGLIHVWKTSIQVIFWQNVRTVWHNEIVTRGSEGEKTSSHIYIISCDDDTVMVISKLSGFNKIQKIGRAIEKETARYLFPAALNSYQMEQRVVFGPLTVTREGLSHASEMLPWHEVQDIKIVDGMIMIMKQGKKESWASVGLITVPNVDVFKKLVQHINVELARELFPAILQRYQIGQPIVFGSLTATHEGLFYRSRRLPWIAVKIERKIKSNEISASRLVIKQRGRPFAWASVDLDMPHVHVFKMLIDHMKDASPGRFSSN